MLTKWVKVDQIIENYKKDYPKEWRSFLLEMKELRKCDQKEGMRVTAKFPAYPDERDISGEIMKIIPDFIINDYKWNRFKKKYPDFFR